MIAYDLRSFVCEWVAMKRMTKQLLKKSQLSERRSVELHTLGPKLQLHGEKGAAADKPGHRSCCGVPKITEVYLKTSFPLTNWMLRSFKTGYRRSIMRNHVGL